MGWLCYNYCSSSQCAPGYWILYSKCRYVDSEGNVLQDKITNYGCIC